MDEVEITPLIEVIEFMVDHRDLEEVVDNFKIILSL